MNAVPIPHSPCPVALQADPGGDRAHLGLQLRGGQRGGQGAPLLLWVHRVQREAAMSQTHCVFPPHPSRHRATVRCCTSPSAASPVSPRTIVRGRGGDFICFSLVELSILLLYCIFFFYPRSEFYFILIFALRFKSQ